MKRNRRNLKREKKRRRNAIGGETHRVLYADLGKKTPKRAKVISPVEQERRRRLGKDFVLPQELQKLADDTKAHA